MKLPAWAPGVVLCIGVLAMTINLWYLLYKSRCPIKTEGFISIPSDGLEETAPSDKDIAGIYRQLMLYVKSDYAKGLKIVYDMNKRIYGKYDKVPDDFDPRRIMDNWNNPLASF